MNYEPVAIINGSTALVEASLALVVGFGANMTPEQVGLVMGVVVAIANTVKTFVARSQVTPVSNPRGRDLKPLKS